MPFADAKYPPQSLPCFTIGGERTTAVPLANGETLLVIEQCSPSEEVVIAIAERGHRDSVDLLVCSISHRGVLAHAYSDDAGERLARSAADA